MASSPLNKTSIPTSASYDCQRVRDDAELRDLEMLWGATANLLAVLLSRNPCSWKLERGFKLQGFGEIGTAGQASSGTQ